MYANTSFSESFSNFSTSFSIFSAESAERHSATTDGAVLGFLVIQRMRNRMAKPARIAINTFLVIFPVFVFVDQIYKKSCNKQKNCCEDTPGVAPSTEVFNRIHRHHMAAKYQEHNCKRCTYKILAIPFHLLYQIHLRRP